MGYVNFKSGIYQIRNKNNNKLYIGSTINLSQRKAYHKYDMKNGEAINKRLKASLKHHGFESYIFEVLETLDLTGLTRDEQDNYLNIIEQIYVDVYNPEYNILKVDVSRATGQKGYNHPERSKSISVFDIDNNYIETIESLRAAGRKYNIKPQRIRDIAECKAFRPHNEFIFKYTTELDKIITFQKNNRSIGKKNPKCIPITSYNINTKEVIIWDYIKEASEYYNINIKKLQYYIRKYKEYQIDNIIFKLKING
jgi:group I intron endonuclease